MFLKVENSMQILIGVVVAAGFLHSGSCLTFPSIIFSDAESNGDNIYGSRLVLTANEKDMMGSLLGAGSVIGAILLSTISSIWGRKPAMICNGLIGFSSWLAVALSPTTTGILIARVFMGLSVGGNSVVSMNYLSETADDKIRGLLCSLNSGFIAMGSLLTIVLGYWFSYYYVSFMNSLLSFVFFFGLLFLPESPKFLTIGGNIEGAKKALSKILKADQEQIDTEVASYIEMNKGKKNFKDIWTELMTTKMMKRISVVSYIFMIRSFGGNEILTINSTRIFSMLSDSGNEELFSIILFLLLVPGIIGSSTFLIDRIGRKKCMYLSLSIGLIGTLLLSLTSFLSPGQLTLSNNFVNAGYDESIYLKNALNLSNSDPIYQNISTLQDIHSNTKYDLHTNNSNLLDNIGMRKKNIFFTTFGIDSSLHKSTINQLNEMMNLTSKHQNYDIDVYNISKEPLQEYRSKLEGNFSDGFLSESSITDNYDWLLLIVSHSGMFIAVFGFSLGIQAVPFVVNAEYFPTWLRAQTSSIGVVSFMLSQFIALQIFTPLVNLLGFGGYMLCSSFILLISIPFIKYCLEETMGKKVG